MGLFYFKFYAEHFVGLIPACMFFLTLVLCLHVWNYLVFWVILFLSILVLSFILLLLLSQKLKCAFLEFCLHLVHFDYNTWNGRFKNP